MDRGSNRHEKIMSKQSRELERHIIETLKQLEDNDAINGLGTDDRRTSLAKQIVESYRRIEYVQIIKRRDIAASRCDPADDRFDPLKAAVAFSRDGDLDESFWMVFYFVHFGKNTKGGWRYAREVYNALGQQDHWTWERTRQNPKAFRKWLGDNEHNIKRAGVPGGFGNHRKYQSLSAHADDQTGPAFESYVEWIGTGSSHVDRFSEIASTSATTPGSRFDALYRSMSDVKSFGRMAKFDYLCMVGKLELFDVEPNSVYIEMATGPKAGGKLLFGGSVDINRSNAQLQSDYATLAESLNLPFSIQILEDAVCNWQKHPDKFVRFRG